MKKDNARELLPVVDENGNVLRSATRGECHGTVAGNVEGKREKLLHPVVHLHLFNSKGELYLQKRPLWKDVQPGKWDTATGGHIDFGESVDQAIVREVREELGISGIRMKFLDKYVFESGIEKELVYIFTAVYDGEVRPSDELDGGAFWSEENLAEAIGKGILTPNFESEYLRFIKGRISL